MSLANHLSKIKSAGIYRFTFDKSEIGGTDAETLRLVVGYSEKGPFNTPTYIESASEFIKVYGNINKKLERRGVWFHRMALQALEAGPIIALNLKKFNNEQVEAVSMNPDSYIGDVIALGIEDVFDTSRFWTLAPEKLTQLRNGSIKNYMTFTATDSADASNTIFVRGYAPSGYDITLKTYYKTVLNDTDLPSWAEAYSNTLVSDYFVQVFVFKGKFTPAVAKSTALSQYFDVENGKVTVKPWLVNTFGEKVDTLDTLAADANSNFVKSYVGVTIPEMMDNSGAPLSIDLIFNQDNATHKMMMHLDSDALYGEDLFTLDDLQTTGFNRLVTKQNITGADEYVLNSGLRILSNSQIVPAIVDAKYNEDLTWEYTKENDYLTEPDLYKFNLKHVAQMDNIIEVYGDDAVAFQSLGLAEGERFAGKEGVATITSITFSNIDSSSDSSDSSDSNEDSTCTIAFDVDPFVETSGDYFAIYKLNHSLSITPCEMEGSYLQGYTYEYAKPKGNSDKDKLEWQTTTLSALSYYTGLRTALTDRVSVDYRYIVDTFESYVDAECKAALTVIAKEKDNALCLTNFPAVETFVNCNYAKFTDKLENDKEGPLQVKYIKSGANRQRPYVKLFSLPTELNGASWSAFYSPLTFTDGYQKINVPAAALVSNNFMAKYEGRQPYYIVAGPNYGRIQASGLVGPDYSYSQADRDILEPMGVNVMMYIPKKGTYINSNQTAKQNPVTALSKINVRELVIYLQDEIESLLQDYQWEMNTATLRDTVKGKADYICEHVKNNGGIEKYLNVCDESNNTDDVINNEMLVLDTSIEPGMGAGKMVQTLTIYKRGGLSSLIQ